MKNTVLQIPMSKELRQSAEKASENLGFSSLQEAIRIFLHKLSSGNMSFSFTEQFPDEKLSTKDAKKYEKIYSDMKAGKNVYEAESIEDLLTQLTSA